MPPFVAGPSNAPIAERYLYLPSIGLAICVAWIVAWAPAWVNERLSASWGWRNVSAGSVAIVTSVLIVAGVFAFGTVTRFGAYSDLESFWATAVRDNPSAGFARSGLAAEYARQGRLEEAEEQFHEAATSGVFEDDSWRGLAWDSLASVYLEQGDYLAAVEAYERGLALYPTSGKIHFNLAVAHYRQSCWLRSQKPEASTPKRSTPTAPSFVSMVGREPRRRRGRN
jgi:tetratricopeptide (TPR) repeat protein